jgi:hypothetical protein
MLNAIMLVAIMLSVIMLGAIMLGVVAPLKAFLANIRLVKKSFLETKQPSLLSDAAQKVL